MAAKKQTSPVAIILIVLLIAAQAYGLYKLVDYLSRKKDSSDAGKKQQDTGGGGTNLVVNNPTPTKPDPVPNPPNVLWTIQRGSPRKTEIRFLQTYLNWKINAGLVVDGIWGSKTDAAVNRAGLNGTLTNLDVKRLNDEYNNRFSLFRQTDPNIRTAPSQSQGVAPSRIPLGLPAEQMQLVRLQGLRVHALK